jgi:hypothetical protein
MNHYLILHLCLVTAVVPVVLAPSSSEELSLPLSLADSELGALPNSAPAPTCYIKYSVYSIVHTEHVNTERVHLVL